MWYHIDRGLSRLCNLHDIGVLFNKKAPDYSYKVWERPWRRQEGVHRWEKPVRDVCAGLCAWSRGKQTETTIIHISSGKHLNFIPSFLPLVCELSRFSHI